MHVCLRRIAPWCYPCSPSLLNVIDIALRNRSEWARSVDFAIPVIAGRVIGRTVGRGLTGPAVALSGRLEIEVAAALQAGLRQIVGFLAATYHLHRALGNQRCPD